MHTEITSIAEIKSSRYIAATRDGARSKDPTKYMKDALVLENALLSEPNNHEYVYYLAQSYYNCQKFDLALENYQKFTQMTKTNNNLYWAKFMIGMLQINLKKDPLIFTKNLTDVFLEDSTRIEPIYYLAEYYANSGMPIIAYSLLRLIVDASPPNNIEKPGAYILQDIYDYKALSLYLNCTIQLRSNTQEIQRLCRILKERPKVPQNIIADIDNLMVSLELPSNSSLIPKVLPEKEMSR